MLHTWFSYAKFVNLHDVASLLIAIIKETYLLERKFILESFWGTHLMMLKFFQTHNLNYPLIILSNTNLISQAPGSLCSEKQVRDKTPNIDKQNPNLGLIPLSFNWSRSWIA